MSTQLRQDQGFGLVAEAGPSPTDSHRKNGELVSNSAIPEAGQQQPANDQHKKAVAELQVASPTRVDKPRAKLITDMFSTAGSPTKPNLAAQQRGVAGTDAVQAGPWAVYRPYEPEAGPYPVAQHHDTLTSVQRDQRSMQQYQGGAIHSGWLHKLAGKTPVDVCWKRYWFYLVGDRLYYSKDVLRDHPASGSNNAQYIPLDRISVRPLPHRRKHAKSSPTSKAYAETSSGPDVGISMVRTEVLQHLKVHLQPDTCFGIVSGSHTYFLAADTPKEARVWVKVLRQAWAHCFQHSMRQADANEMVHQNTRLIAQNDMLRQSLLLTKAQPQGYDSEYWTCWLEEKAKNQQLEAAMSSNAVYEVEVKTGGTKGANTSARVYIEMYGPYDDVATGEVRLVHADSHQQCYERGALDLFEVTAKDVGLPKTIKVWHDNTGRHPDWYLDYIRVRKRAGRAAPGHSPYVSSPTATVKPQSPQAIGYASNPRPGSPSPGNANTHVRSSAVYDSPTGTHHTPAATRMSPLRHSVTSVMTSSTIAARYPDGGLNSPAKSPMAGASPMLFNANFGNAWSDWVVFPCQRWLSVNRDDARISRTLYAGHLSPLIQYKVCVHTSDVRGAGTDANVHLILHGTLGDGKHHILTSGPMDFERGVVNEFSIDDEELGDLMEVTVGHDNTGHAPAWHLDHLSITNCKNNTTYVFASRQWFDKLMGDGLTERRLPVVPEAGKLVPYTFIVHTSNIKGAGTDADVHVALHGSLGDTDAQLLPSRPEHFERGSVDTFKGIVLPWVGDIRSLTIGHNDKGAGPEWHLDLVEVIDEQHKKHYWFVCGKWFGSKTEDGSVLERTLVASKEDPTTGYANYKVEFHTSSLRGAGTDATVYFQLVGDMGEGETQRVSAGQEAFERGNVDEFDYRMRYLGKLRKMRIQHDNSGANPAWHLFKVVVTCTKDGSTTTFVCNDWLRSTAPGVFPSVELLASDTGAQLLTYRLEAATSDVRGAGTDSSVWLEIHGAQGKVAAQQLDRPGAFERGARDVIEVIGVDVGQLTKLVVKVDPLGKRPLWHLDSITVQRLPISGGDAFDTTWFPCRQWFDQQSGLIHELLPVMKGRDLPKRWVKVYVATSDLKGAATDASIQMNMVGSHGETGWYPLPGSHGQDLFERGQEDVFSLELPDVGQPHHLLLRTDGRSAKPCWHVDWVVVEPDKAHTGSNNSAAAAAYAAPMSAAYFVGRCWLGPSPQFETQVQLPAVLVDPRGGQGEYSIWAYTSDVKNAGTDASICIEMVGDQGTTGRLPLTHPTADLFERGKVDAFKLKGTKVGALRALRVFTDAKSNKPTWHLDYIEIQVPTGQKYYFMCGGWLGPERLQVELPASLDDPAKGRCKYKVVVHTSDIRGAGTDANVYVNIQGTAGTTGKTFLKNANVNLFERGQADEFEVIAPHELGCLSPLVIGHDNTGQGPSWHCEQIDITDVKNNQTYYFDCNQWFDATQGDKKIERILKPSKVNPRTARTVYFISVKTGSMPGAGTDAHVYMELRGEAGSSGKQFLKNASPNPFESGMTDEFQLPLRSLGALQELVIGHDNSGMQPDWFCETVSVTDLTTKITYWFACGKWFGTNREDGRIERVLKASLTPPDAKRKVPYKIVVHTSDVSGAGTDANVWVVLHGEDGSNTGKLTLDRKGTNCFEQNKKDEFLVTTLEVDPLRKLRVGHDNSGVGPAWHLTSIEVTNTLTNKKYLFPCNRWLSTKHDDFQIERDLFLNGTPEHTYTIEVFTSNLSGAGTDATVHCILYGEKGETGQLLLDNPKNNFEQGARDVFSIRAEDIGALRKMKIWSDGKGMGSAWHMDVATVVSSAKPDVKWWFYCGQWLDEVHGLERLLTAFPSDPRLNLSTYTVTVHTSDVSGAGTDANVYINIFGVKEESGARDLKGSGNLFECGAANKFELKLLNLGDLQEMEVWHDNSGAGPAWHLNYIEVACSSSSKVVYFPCNKWFDKKQGDGLIRRQLKATLQNDFNSNYRVTTLTSDVFGAGTDANVFITIYGPDGDTGKIQLDNPLKNDFERGQTDVFDFSATSVGKPMSKIRIGHDGSGAGAGWHLNHVIVENLKTGERATFKCNMWLDKGKEDGAIEIDLKPDLVIPNAVNWKLTIVTGNDMGAGTDADVFVSLQGQLDAFGPHTLTAHKGAFEQGSRDDFSLTTQPLGMIQTMTLGHNGKGLGAAWQVDTAELENMATGEKWWFDFKCWLDNGKGMSTTRAPVRYRGPRGKCDYRVELTTGPNNESRLDKGNVVLDIRGQELSTGRQSLDAPPQGWWPSRVEAYGLVGLTDTGGIMQLELGHTGLEPWFLKEVLVMNETTGARGLFLIDRVIHPGEFLMLDVQGAAPVDYAVEVSTSDRWNAGTSAAVFINVFGTQGSTGRTCLSDTPVGCGAKGTLPTFCSTTDASEPKSAAFTRGGRGTFTLKGLPDVGIIQQLEIGHDNSGCSPGWHLAWVKVTNLRTNTSAFFPCNQWLAKNEADRKITRLLEADTPSNHQMPSSNDLLQPTAVALVQIAQPEVPAQKLTAVGPPGYKLVFVTSNVCMAGTGAPVFFELVGEFGSSGTVVTRAMLGQFARASCDEFVYPRLPYLGDLLQLRVGTTGEGMFADWHLKMVEVTHTSSGKVWRFSCHDWLNKKCQWQRVLTAQPA